jgi:hypothetical protein
MSDDDDPHGAGDSLMAPDDATGRVCTEILCVECGRSWTNPREHWRLYVCDESDGDPQAMDTGAYCPSCAQREFGDPGSLLLAVASDALRCQECPVEWTPDQTTRWRVYLTPDDPPEIALYCPACAAREFGSGS